MSLGVRPLWRARYHSIGAIRLSLIPRDRFSSSTTLTPVHAATGQPQIQASATKLSRGEVLIKNLMGSPYRRAARNESVLVAPARTYPHKSETARSLREHTKSATTQERLKAISRALKRPLPDWRVVLRNLTAWTPQRSAYSKQDVRTNTLPKNTSWGRLREDDAKIMSLKAREELGQGTAAIQDAIHDDTKTLGKSSNELEVLGSNGQTELAERDVFRPYTLTKSANDIPRPSEWTVESFERYIAALVNARLPPHLHKQLYPRGTSHQLAVISLLHQAFNDKKAQPVITPSAFKMALSYMAVKGPGFRPDVRALYVRMEMNGLQMDTETFNILLRSTVRINDLRNFDLTTRLMNRRGFPPDLSTWILFLRIFENEEVQRHILQAMHSKGLLDIPAAARQLAAVMAPHDTDRAVERNMTMPAFLGSQATRYGEDWLSQQAANKIVDTLGRYGKFGSCCQLIHAMTCTPNAQPNTSTVNIVLTHCKVHNSLGTAIRVLKHVETSFAFVPDAVTYQLLFDMGWQRRLAHTMGVGWRYASLANLASWSMRRKTTKVLANAAGPHSQRFFPGSFVKDAELQGARGPGKRRSRTYLGTVASKWFAARYAKWRPALPLGEALERAYREDCQLLRSGKEGGGQPGVAEPFYLPLKRKLGGRQGFRKVQK